MAASPGRAPVAVELTAAGCRFDTGAALHPVSLRVERGTSCLVHGPNGSGKTTLLRLCAGLLRPSSGERHAPGRCVYLRPGSGGRRRQTVREVLDTARRLSGQPPGALDEAVRAAGLGPLAGRRIDTLSSGQRGRLLVGLALCTAADLVCLDEPDVHLDAAGRQAATAALARLLDSGAAVMVAGPEPSALVRAPDALLMVDSGVVSGTP